MRAKFVKLKSWDWNICSSVAHPPPLCISSRVPVNPTCVSSQTLCFILYILFKPLPVNSFFSCIPKHHFDFFFFLLFHCQYTPFSILKRKHLYILPNTIWFFLLYTLHPFQTTASILLFSFKKKTLLYPPKHQLDAFCFILYILSQTRESVFIEKESTCIYLYTLSEAHQATKPLLV